MTVATIQLHEPHAAQQQVMDEARRFNVLACGRRWGKTDLCMDSLAIPPALDGWPVGWFAPTYKLLGEAWDDCITCLKPMRDMLTINKQDRKITFPGGGLIEFWSTEPQIAGDNDSDVARGRHYKRVVYDEAARARRLEADWTKAIMPTLADLQGDAWFPSTPKGRNYFHRMFMRGQSDDRNWKSWRMPTASNPLIQPEEIENARLELPRDAFEQEYLAEFLANAANPFGIDAIRAAIDESITPDGQSVAYWGVDLAKSTDWVVAVGLDGDGRMVAFQRWQSDWRATRHRLIAMLKGTPAKIDETGVGNPIVEDVAESCPRAEGYTFTSQSKQKLMEGLAYAIQNQRVTYPRNEVLINELESFQYEYKPSRVYYSAPSGLHDDCVMALALAVECMRVSAGSEPRLSVLSVDTGGRLDDFDPWGGLDND